jgi:amidophosphoribosyltransferase
MCGIFGIYNHPEASNHAYSGLYALQARGQERATGDYPYPIQMNLE